MEHLPRELSVFQSVIVAIIEDFIRPPRAELHPDIKICEHVQSRRLITDRTGEYAAHFEYICDLGGVNPDWIRSLACRLREEYIAHGYSKKPMVVISHALKTGTLGKGYKIEHKKRTRRRKAA